MDKNFLECCIKSFDINMLNKLYEATRIVFDLNGDPRDIANYSYFEKYDGYWWNGDVRVSEENVLSAVHAYMLKHELMEPHIY